MSSFKGALFVLFVSSLLMFSCNKSENKNKMSERKPIDPMNIDTTVKPGEDFFMYANGGWIKANPVPEEFSRYGAFEALLEENNEALRKLFEDAAYNSKPVKGSVLQKIGDFYSSGMDTKKIEKEGVAPLKPELDKINNIKNSKDIARMIAHQHRIGIAPMFYIYAAQDEMNSERMIANLYQGGLGLPDRDYYTSTDENSANIRNKYIEHIEKMFKLMGVSGEKAKESAQTIMKFETRLANASHTRLEQRDPHNNYNKMNVAGVKKVSPNFDWDLYFNEIGLSSPGNLNIAQTKFFAEADKMINEVPVEEWKTYFRWNLVNGLADYLSSNFEKQNFDFYGKTLSGKKKDRDRWKKALSATSGSLGELVGQLYVKKYFPPQAKEKMLTLVQNLKSALGERINKLEWMSPETKKEALAKLNKMNVKIGYPDKWRDYSGLDIKKDSYVANIIRANEFDFVFNMKKVNKPVDRNEWHMTPQTVNAYYSPNMNEIVFPAAILQYPFFHLNGDDAVNYGAIGVIIGHEMTHGFDDQGRQYDKDGNLKDWWKPEDAEKFNKQVGVLVSQYDTFQAIDTMHVNGKLTLGENIADLGGLTVAYTALEKALGKDPRYASKLEGYTPQQRFFLSYAQVWRQTIRPEELKRRLREDVHSPGNFRTNGPVVHLAEFYQAFGVKETDKLFVPIDKRAIIW